MLCVSNIIRQNGVFNMMNFKNVRVMQPWTVNQRNATSQSKSKNQITYKTYVPPCVQDHDLKNMSIRRPMSPHLTIYKPTLQATTSILQRITGLVVTAYAVLLAGGALFLTNGIETYVLMIQSLDLSRPSVFIIKALLGMPFAFHYFNGIRFCAWNAGRLLAKKDVVDSAIKSWVASAVIIVLFAIL